MLIHTKNTTSVPSDVFVSIMPAQPHSLYRQETKLPGAETYFPEDEEWLRNVEWQVRQNMANNHFSVVQLADSVAISERQLRRRLKRLLGMGPWHYLTKIRLEHAHEILRKRKYKTLTQIAFAVGYRDVDSFRVKFKEHYGRTPMDYLR